MFEEKVLLNQYSHYRIGGPARYFFEAENVEEIIKAVEKWRRLASRQIRKADFGSGVFIFGGGTNVLISDEGFNGLVLKPNLQFAEKDGNSARVGAGILMSGLLSFLADESLSGLEWAGGLPGTLGGAIRGNAGAFGGEIKDCIKEVVSLDISNKNPKIIRRKKSQCGFVYRSSVFKEGGGKEIILEAILDLKRGDKKAIQEAVSQKIQFREQRHPMDYPSLGSTFKNIDLKKFPKSQQSAFAKAIKTDPFPIIPAAYLIEQAGLKGVSCGGAMISPKHANFIVNVLNAKAGDVKNLIRLAEFTIKKKFGINLEEEIEYL